MYPAGASAWPLLSDSHCGAVCRLAAAAEQPVIGIFLADRQDLDLTDVRLALAAAPAGMRAVDARAFAVLLHPAPVLPV